MMTFLLLLFGIPTAFGLITYIGCGVVSGMLGRDFMTSMEAVGRLGDFRKAQAFEREREHTDVMAAIRWDERLDGLRATAARKALLGSAGRHALVS